MAQTVAVLVVRLHLFELPAKPVVLPKPAPLMRRHFI